MALTPTKLEFPTGQDPFQPHRDIKKLAESATVIVPVANRQEADDIAGILNPSVDDPLFVDRADNGHVEVNRGDGWNTIYPNAAIAGRRWGGDSQNFSNGNVVVYGFPDGEFTYTGGVTGAAGGMRVPITGWYQITASIRWGSPGGGGYRQVRININGLTVAVSQKDVSYSNFADTVTQAVPLQAEDHVQMAVYQNSGGTLSSLPALGMPALSVAFIGV